MPVASSTIGGVNTWTFSGAVTDAEIKAAWASLVVNGVYVINRAIYLTNTADMSAVTGGLLVDFGTQVDPGFILHTGRDKTKSTFKNFTFLIRTGLIVPNRGNLVKGWDGAAFIQTAASGDGLSQDGGGFVYGVAGVAPGGGDNRYLLELPFDSVSNVTTYSQEFTEQELQILVNQSKVLKGLIFEKAYGFPQIGTPTASTGVVVYRSTQNTQSTAGGGLIPIRLYPTPAGSGRYASVCYVDSYLTRNNADITTRLIDTFSSSSVNRAHITILNNYTRGTWFGTAKTVFTTPSNWVATNTIYGGVLKKLQFVGGDGGVVRAYDSRSTTAAQKCKFAETGFVDFLDTDLAPTTDSEGKIQLTHIGAIATGTTTAITRYTGQKYTFQKFGYRVYVATPDMTGGDNDLSAFTPVILTAQDGLSRTQAEINAATSINSFQELLEELHVLSLSQVGAASYNGYANGNLFNFSGGVLTTNFASVTVDATAASKISYNSTTNALIIKSSVLDSNSTVATWNNAVGTITLANGAVIQGVYVTSSGTSTTWEFQDVEVGTSLAIYDASGVTKYFQGEVATAGTYRYYIAPQATGETYTYAIEKYGTRRETGSFPSNAGGVLFYVPSYAEDVGITETNKATVAAYTAVDNLDKFYDSVAYYRLSEAGIKLGQLAERNGSAVDIGTHSLVVNQSASVNVAATSSLITIKSSTLANGTKFTLITATPPKTVTANTNEVISASIEDANGNSSVTIQGGSGDFTLWKITNATSEDDYATGTDLGDVGNITYRFLSDPGYKIVIRDNITSFRQVVSMDKGIYTRGLFFGDQVQLAQSAEVTQINNKVDILQADVDNIMGSFDVSTDNLAAISDTLDLVKGKTDGLTFTQAGVIDANIQYVNDIEVKGTGEDDNPWNPV
jgi:hypothetical protein